MRHLSGGRGLCRISCVSKHSTCRMVGPRKYQYADVGALVYIPGQKRRKGRVGVHIFAELSSSHADGAHGGGVSRIGVMVSRIGLGILVCTAAMAWGLPRALSSRRGLRAALYIANKVAPVSIQVDSVDMRWGTKKPYLKNVRVGCGAEECLSIDRIQCSKSLWQMLGRHQKAEIFLHHPVLNLETDDQGQIRMLNELERRGVLARGDGVEQPILPEAFRGSMHVKHPFSAEMVFDDRITCFASEGSLRVNEEISQLLGGRLFIQLCQEALPSGRRVEGNRRLVSHIAVDMDSPAFHLDMKGSQTNKDDLYLDEESPVHVDTRVTQAFSNAVMALINPLFIGGVDVTSELPIKMSITSENGILPAERMIASIAPWSAQVEQGPLLRDVIRVLTMLSDASIGSKYPGFRHALKKDMSISVSSSEARVTVSDNGASVTSDIASLSLRIPGIAYPIDLGVRATIHGTGPDATMDTMLQISAPTVQHIIGGHIQDLKPFSIAIRGTLSKPSINFKSVLSDVGLLVLQSKVSSPLSTK